MKLQTSIQPRRNGVVTVTGQDRQNYVFEAGPDGELCCDVTDEATVASLLQGGMFFPADPADFDAALALTQADEEDDGGDTAEGEDDDGESLDALPVEAETPPAAAPGRKTRKAR